MFFQVMPTCCPLFESVHSKQRENEQLFAKLSQTRKYDIPGRACMEVLHDFVSCLIPHRSFHMMDVKIYLHENVTGAGNFQIFFDAT